MQDNNPDVVAALSRGQLAAAPLAPPERGLLEYVELLTRHSYRATAEDAQRLRDLGWTEPQIAETVYVTALFAFFNRVADAFGLADPGYAKTGLRPRHAPPPEPRA